MITKDDIAAKATEVKVAIEDTKAAAQNTAVLAGVAIIAVVALAFFLGKRKSRPGKAVVEVYRVR